MVAIGDNAAPLNALAEALQPFYPGAQAIHTGGGVESVEFELRTTGTARTALATLDDEDDWGFGLLDAEGGYICGHKLGTLGDDLGALIKRMQTLLANTHDHCTSWW